VSTVRHQTIAGLAPHQGRSCAGHSRLSRLSTAPRVRRRGPADEEDVDARHKTGHDDGVCGVETRFTNWLTRERLIVWTMFLAIAEAGLFAFCVAGTHGWIVPIDHQPSTDFASFHAAGALADAGTPWLAYDHIAHHAAEQASSGIATAYNYFYYPPVFLLICAPFAWLPYLPSFLLFQAMSAIACHFAVKLIRRDVPIVVLLAFPAVWWTFGTGQNALLTGALFAAGTALIDRRPILAGICFGALCYKPHFGLLIPVALIAGGYWRAVVSAGGTVMALVAASIALFGAQTWQAFCTAVAGSDSVYAAHAIFMSGLTSPYGALMALGADRQVAFAAQALAILIAVLAVTWVWRRQAPLPLRAALLLTATPVAVPVLMFYDLILVFVALVWLSCLWPAEPRSWRVPATAAVFLGPLLSGNLSAQSIWPWAFATASLAFTLTAAIAWRVLAAPRLAPEPAVIAAE
jgi:alpha-1,2-mannosyltransferase